LDLWTFSCLNFWTFGLWTFFRKPFLDDTRDVVAPMHIIQARQRDHGSCLFWHVALRVLSNFSTTEDGHVVIQCRTTRFFFHTSTSVSLISDFWPKLLRGGRTCYPATPLKVGDIWSINPPDSATFVGRRRPSSSRFGRLSNIFPTATSASPVSDFWPKLLRGGRTCYPATPLKLGDIW